MEAWANDVSFERENPISQQRVISRLKERWAMGLVAQLAEVLDVEYDLSMQHLELTTHATSGNYKIELSMTPVFEIEDESEDEQPAEEVVTDEDDMSDYSDGDGREWSSSPVPEHTAPAFIRDPATQYSVPAQRLSAGIDHTHANVDVGYMHVDPTRALVNGITRPQAAVQPVMSQPKYLRFEAYGTHECNLLLRIPKLLSRKRNDETMKADIDLAIRQRLTGQITLRYFLGSELYYRQNRKCATSRSVHRASHVARRKSLAGE